MDIIHLGHASFKIRGRQAALVTDPFSPIATGLKFPKVEADIVTISHDHDDHNFVGIGKWEVGNETLIIHGPGEYEARGVKILGITSYHDNTSGSQRGLNTIYQIQMDNVTLVHLGDLGDKLTDGQKEALNGVDVLMVPVGGVYTINAKAAAEIVSQIEPRLVIPMHYRVPGLIFDLDPVDEFLKEMGKEDTKAQPKLSITKDKLPEEMEIVILE